MRGKGKSGATTAAKENAVNTVAKKAESTIEAVAEKAKEAVKKVDSSAFLVTMESNEVRGKGFKPI